MLLESQVILACFAKFLGNFGLVGRSISNLIEFFKILSNFGATCRTLVLAHYVGLNLGAVGRIICNFRKFVKTVHYRYYTEICSI